jgi:hypothetical protein
MPFDMFDQLIQMAQRLRIGTPAGNQSLLGICQAGPTPENGDGVVLNYR